MNEETGWLIEHPHDPRYGRESWYAGKDGFTIDSLQAVRFARQEDAMREIDRFPVSVSKNLRAEERAWCGPTPGVEEMYPQQRGESCDDAPDETEWRARHENLLNLLAKLKVEIGKRNFEVDSLRFEIDRLRQRRCQSCDAKQAEVEKQTKRAEEFLNLLHERDETYARDAQKRLEGAMAAHREDASRLGYDRALQDIGYTVSVGMIAAERRRQVEGESWTSLHDDGHDAGQLALAAACYAIESAGRGSFEVRLGHGGGLEINVDALGLYWPFDKEWFKPGSEIRSLVKAGSLIAAEIDRRLRAREEP